MAFLAGLVDLTTQMETDASFTKCQMKIRDVHDSWKYLRITANGKSYMHLFVNYMPDIQTLE